MKQPLKKLLETVGGKSAAEKHRAQLAALDAEEKKIRDERATLEADVETRTAAGEDPADAAARIVEITAALSPISIRRAPLQRFIAEADEVERKRLEADRRARWTATLEAKREEASRVRVAAVGALADGLRAIARLDVLEREAQALADRLGTMGLSRDSSSDAVAADAAALYLDGTPEGVDPYAAHVVVKLSVSTLRAAD